MLYGPTLILLENGSDFEEEVGLQEGLVRAVVRPDAEQARAVTVAKPIGDLFDGGLFEIVGQRRLAGVRRIAGQHVAASVCDASDRQVDG